MLLSAESKFLILQLRMELPLKLINEALVSAQGISEEQYSSLLQRLSELFLQLFQLLLDLESETNSNIPNKVSNMEVQSTNHKYLVLFNGKCSMLFKYKMGKADYRSLVLLNQVSYIFYQIYHSNLLNCSCVKTVL